MRFSTPTHEQLQEYYGRILTGSKDLKTNACCCGEEAMPLIIRQILREIDSEIIERFYGCGSPIPLWRWTAAIPHRCSKTHAFPGTSKSPATERCITGPSTAPRHLSRRMTRTATAAAPAVRDSF